MLLWILVAFVAFLLLNTVWVLFYIRLIANPSARRERPSAVVYAIDSFPRVSRAGQGKRCSR